MDVCVDLAFKPLRLFPAHPRADWVGCFRLGLVLVAVFRMNAFVSARVVF